jgi:hypothetical protein
MLKMLNYRLVRQRQQFVAVDTLGKINGILDTQPYPSPLLHLYEL